MLENVEAERGRMQMSKQMLSEKLNITCKTYNRYVSGEPIPSDKLVAMAKLFGCSTDYLLGRTDIRATPSYKA